MLGDSLVLPSYDAAPLSARGEGSSPLKAAGHELTISPKARMKLSRDVCPEVALAGKPGETDLFARGLSKNIVMASPRTPDMGDVRMRHRRRTEAGHMTVHWGSQKLKIPEAPDKGYGIQTQKCESVARTLKSAEVVGMAEYLKTFAESKYKSTSEEPLGQGAIRPGIVPPASTREDSFPGFGKPSPRGPVTGKETIFPRGVDPVSASDKAMYQRTHHSFDPGEMFKRGYYWPSAICDNANFQFGLEKKDKLPAGSGVKQAMSCNTKDATGNVPTTQLVSHASQCYQQAVADPLAQSRNILCGKPKVPASHAFGQPSNKEQTSVGLLMRHFNKTEDLMPEKDLGRCVVQGRRNFITEMPFGTPTIRKDKTAPAFEHRSVASNTNYGDDVGAYGLLFPDKWRVGGLSRDDLEARRTSRELQELLESAGHPLNAIAFEGIFCSACNMYADGQRLASLEAILKVCAQPDSDAPSARVREDK